jgi:alkylated DNA repair dioxygenase AlkB
MAEQMTKDQVLFQERLNTGTSKTNNEFFEKNGYLVIKNIWDILELSRPVPQERGQVNYWGNKLDQYTYTEVENQVEGSFASYWHPQYRSIHSGIRLKLEKELGKKLYNTYYYDRFYFPGQELAQHSDRDACEISVTVHIGSNLQTPWPIWIKTPDTYANKKKTTIIKKGENRSVILNPGDGMVYKGCERPHWRDPMPTEYKKTWYGKKIKKDDLYYHQIFFHYVLADGYRVQCAFDACN